MVNFCRQNIHWELGNIEVEPHAYDMILKSKNSSDRHKSKSYLKTSHKSPKLSGIDSNFNLFVDKGYGSQHKKESLREVTGSTDRIRLPTRPEYDSAADDPPSFDLGNNQSKQSKLVISDKL
jgi:hypothetical protein